MQRRPARGLATAAALVDRHSPAQYRCIQQVAQHLPLLHFLVCSCRAQRHICLLRPPCPLLSTYVEHLRWERWLEPPAAAAAAPPRLTPAACSASPTLGA